MAITARNQLKQWFETGDYPTQEQFANWLDSYWHKTDELIPVARIDGLSGIINNVPIEGTVTASTPLELVVPAGTLVITIIGIGDNNTTLSAGYATGDTDINPLDDVLEIVAGVPLDLQPTIRFYVEETTFYFEITTGSLDIKIYKQ